MCSLESLNWIGGFKSNQRVYYHLCKFRALPNYALMMITLRSLTFTNLFATHET